jgi:hypothetical protein
MSAPLSDAVPTRLLDMSQVSLADLDLCDPAQLSLVIEPLVREVSASVVVSLAGSDS